MDKQRVNCYLAGCDKCTEATLVGVNLFNDKLYLCHAYKRKHRKKNARKCESFRCKKPYKSNKICLNCTRGR